MHWAQALPLLYSTVNSTDKMPLALDEVARHSLAIGGLFASIDKTGFLYNENYGSSLYAGSEALIAEYFARFQKIEDDVWRKMQAMPYGDPLCDFDLWPEGHQIKQRADVRFCAEHFGFYRRLGYNLSRNLGSDAGFIFHYPVAHDEIPRTAFEQSRHFVPHLAKVAELMRFVSGLKRKYNAVYSMLDKISIGMVVLDEQNRVVVANDAAGNMSRQGDGLAIASGYLRLGDPDLNAELTAMLCLAVSTASGDSAQSESMLVVERPSGKLPYTLMIAPLKDGSAEIEREFSGTLALMFDTNDPPPIDITPLSQLAGLTRAETETTRLLLQGHTDREIADIRSVVYETVRSQIKRILNKTAASSRVDLMRKASMILPPVT